MTIPLRCVVMTIPWLLLLAGCTGGTPGPDPSVDGDVGTTGNEDSTLPGDGGTVVGDGGGADGGGGGGTGGGTPIFGVPNYDYARCDDFTVTLDDLVVDLGAPGEWAIVGPVVVQPAKGETCQPSLWMDQHWYFGSTYLSVYFDAASADDLDGAQGVLDATSAWDHAGTPGFQQIRLYNKNPDGTWGRFLPDNPEVAAAYVDGEITWTQVDDSTGRLNFSTLCWQADSSGDPPSICADYDTAYLELTCDFVTSDAGAVGIASWDSTPDGDPLCILEDPRGR